jgi:hypothetical protein
MPTKPTDRQVNFLSARGITIPVSKDQARHLISFLVHGYSPDQCLKESERIALIKFWEAKLLNKKVLHTDINRTGTVIALSARSPEERRDWIRAGARPAYYPITAVVKFDPPGRRCVISVAPSFLKILSSQEQKDPT